MLKIENLQTEELTIPFFEAKPGEGWCIIGVNASGVDRLVDVLGKEDLEQC